MKILLKLNLLVSAAVVCLPVTVAHAQDGAPQDASAPVGLEDIVVTARRRAENIQNVPVAVTALTDSVLREKAIQTPYDLVQSTPGIAAVTGSSQRNDVLYFIRGQGATFGSSPSVVTYFADVPQQTNAASGGSNITFYDIESIQVLKGPQGTLFGRSTTAGAVLISPKKPSGEFDGFMEASLTSYSGRELTGAINIPIIGDKLAIRFAGNYSYREGFARSLTTGQDLDDRNRSSYRIQILAQPTDWFSNNLLFTDNDIHENGTAAVLGAFEPNGTARLVTDPRLPFNPAFGGNSVLTGSLLDTTPGGIGVGGLGYVSVAGLCGNAALAPFLASIGQTVPQCIAQRVGAIDKVRTALAGEFARIQGGGDVRRLLTTRDNYIRSQVQQIINTTQIQFGRLGFLGETSFKNIFSTTRNLHSEAIREIQGGVGTGVVFNDVNYTDPNCAIQCSSGQGIVTDYGAGRNDWFDVFSEEAQLSGRIADRHDWIVGFFTEEQHTNQYLNKPAVFLTLGGAFTVPFGLPGISTGFNQPYKFSQTGYFGQTTIDLGDFGLDGLKFTAGYRRSIVRNSLVAIDASIDPFTGIVQSTAPGIPAKVVQKADSYTFALDYKISDRVLVYGTTRKGFKQGGINIQSVVPANNGIAGAQPTFAPENVTDYEIGVKADYDLGGVAMRTNIAAFTSKFTGLHRASSFFNGQTTSNQIVNAAGLRSKGIELEQTLRFGRNFTTNISYAYLDSNFTNFDGVTVRPSDGAVLPRIDTPVTGAPKHHLDVAMRYTHDLGPDTGNLVLAGNVSYQSRTHISDDALFALNPEDQAPYALANLRLDWNNVMGHPVDASVFAKNLFDKTYRIGAGNLISSGLGTTTYIYGDPLVVGIQLRARFGASAE